MVILTSYLIEISRTTIIYYYHYHYHYLSAWEQHQSFVLVSMSDHHSGIRS